MVDIMKNVITIYTILALLLFASMTVTLGSSVKADGENIIYVDDDATHDWYDSTHVKTIQEGIDNASDDDTIFVYNGTYYENIIVNKRVDLIGEDRDNTIISGNGSSDVVKLSFVFGLVELSGFTIKNSGFGNNAIKFLPGMYATKSNINNNRITDNYCGIFFYLLSSSSVVTENIIEHNTWSGIYMELSTSININSNKITNNTFGILTDTFSNVKINENSVINNTFGINLSDDQPIDDIPGWAIFKVMPSSVHNNNNNFIDNGINAVDEQSIIQNSWDANCSLGGNYWDDYLGIDSDGDGTGDTPYNISGGNSKDYYPLMEPYSPPVQAELKVSIETGFSFKKVSTKVENIGDSSANNVNLSIYVEYGLLKKKINSSIEFNVLEPGSVSELLTLDDLRGFGKIKVTAELKADNANAVNTTASGWIIGRFIFLS